MKYGKTFLLPLGIGIVLSLLMVLIPAKPVLAAPTITLSPNSGAICTRVTITGTNFDSYVGDRLSILFNDVEIAGSPVTVPDTGNFDAVFDVPTSAAAGTARVTVRGQLGSILAESSFVIPETEIRLDIEEGTVGTVVTATGQGFCADKMVTLYFSFDGLREKLGTTLAGLTGTCSLQFAIPVSTAGMQRIVVEGAADNSAEAQFNVLPSASVNPSSAAVGEAVSVSGTGFHQNGQITIALGTTTVAFAEADEYGSFASIFTVPVVKSRTYILKMQDNRGNVDWAEFIVAAGAKLNKATGSVGTEIIVSGTGFTGGAKVTIKYDALEVATDTADIDGVFSTAFDVPISVSGGHLITVSDGTSTRHLAFTMESAAPPAPALLLPETGIEAESPVYFHWQEVDDPSLPITYSLQVASDEGFTAIVLPKEKLSDPEYTLTEDEKLKPTKKEAPYYWRVKATDGASNESEWSGPGSFYIGSSSFLPYWAIYALIGVGVLVVGFVIFRVWWTRRSYY